MAAKLPNYSVTESQLGGIVLLVDEAGNPLIVTGRTLTNARPVDVSIVDANGNQITSFGGGTGGGAGTEYADGAVRGTATGTLAMGDDGTNIQSVKVDASGVLAIQDNGGSLTVDGTFFQATQPISAAALPLPAGAATSALQTQPGVDIGDVTVNNAAGAAAVNVQDGGNSITVDGTFFQATQPVSAASLPLPIGAATSALQTQPGVDIGDVTINNAAGAAAVNVQDGGNSLTVDGAISFTAPQHVIVDSGGGGGIQFADGAARGTATGTIAMGDDGTNIQSIKVDTSGVLAIQDNGGSITVDAPVGTPLFARLSDGAAALIGQKVMASSLPIVIASDQTAVPISGDVDHDAVNTLKNLQIAGHASPSDVPPTAVSANGDRVRAWMDRYGAQIIRPRKIRESYTAVFRLDGATAGRMDQTFTQVANTDKQWATIYHPLAATKDVRLLKVTCYITAFSAASQAILELRYLSGITPPATGNPAIVPTNRRGSAGTAAECTCLYLPTTQGSISSVNAVAASLIYDLGIMGAASAANPAQPIAITLYDASAEDPELIPPTLQTVAGIGLAVVLRTVGTPAVRMTVVMVFTEEVP